MESQNRYLSGNRTESWMVLVLCAAVLAAGVMEYLVHNRLGYAKDFAPNWAPFAAAAFAVAGAMQLNANTLWLRIQRVLLWSGLLLMVWVANGLPLDLFRIVGLIPLGVDWPGLLTRTLALAAVIVLARFVMARPAVSATIRAATWYGYAAFVFALPYPVLRVHWALGGTLGLSGSGAAGKGFIPLLLTIPFLLAAALSLLLVSPRRWPPRRLLLAAGWIATAITAMIGPAACWSLVSGLLKGGYNSDPKSDIAFWIFCLFYGSWFLFAIAEGAATRSYQLRSAALRTP